MQGTQLSFKSSYIFISPATTLICSYFFFCLSSHVYFKRRLLIRWITHGCCVSYGILFYTYIFFLILYAKKISTKLIGQMSNKLNKFQCIEFIYFDSLFFSIIRKMRLLFFSCWWHFTRYRASVTNYLIIACVKHSVGYSNHF